MQLVKQIKYRSRHAFSLFGALRMLTSISSTKGNTDTRDQLAVSQHIVFQENILRRALSSNKVTSISTFLAKKMFSHCPPFPKSSDISSYMRYILYPNMLKKEVAVYLNSYMFPINQFEEQQIEKYLHQLTDEVALTRENLQTK